MTYEIPRVGNWGSQIIEVVDGWAITPSCKVKLSTVPHRLVTSLIFENGSVDWISTFHFLRQDIHKNIDSIFNKK